VNRIAAIVHACVHEFAGAINKNIGEAFLMVWPLEHRTEKRARLQLARNCTGPLVTGNLHSPGLRSQGPPSPGKSPFRGGWQQSPLTRGRRPSTGIVSSRGDGGVTRGFGGQSATIDPGVRRPSLTVPLPGSGGRGGGGAPQRILPRIAPNLNSFQTERKGRKSSVDTQGSFGNESQGSVGEGRGLDEQRSNSDGRSSFASQGASSAESSRHASSSPGHSATGVPGESRTADAGAQGTGQTQALLSDAPDVPQRPGFRSCGYSAPFDALLPNGAQALLSDEPDIPQRVLPCRNESRRGSDPHASLPSCSSRSRRGSDKEESAPQALSEGPGVPQRRARRSQSAGDTGPPRRPRLSRTESQKRNTDNGALGQRRGTDEKAAAILARSFRCDNSNSSFARSRFGDGRSASLLQQPFSLDTGSASASPPASQDASPSNSPGVAIPPSGMSPVDGVVPRPGVPSSSGGRTSGWESDGSNSPLARAAQTYTTADCAVAGFALCALLIKANKQLVQLCQNELLQKVHPGFKVETGYGLHMGWAIEGAIGSDLKIDASYLSPNVNLASRLEAATKQYGVRILLSEHVASLMSAKCKACLRKVDRVTVKGSARPLTLYTLDILEDLENLRLADKLDPTTTGSSPEDETEAQRQRALAQGPLAADADAELLDAEQEALEELEREVRTFRRTKAVYDLKRTTTLAFLQLWDQGLQLYLRGSWAEAHALFAQCKELLPDDGPTETLMVYIERRNLQAPAGWKGVRELTSK